MAARRPFWKWHCWKSIGFCLWPPSTCIWNLKLKFQSKLDLCSGNHVVYRQTDGQTDRRTRWIQYTPPPTSLGGGINISKGIDCNTKTMHIFVPIYIVQWLIKTIGEYSELGSHFKLSSCTYEFSFWFASTNDKQHSHIFLEGYTSRIFWLTII